MKKQTFKFSGSSTEINFNSDFRELKKITNPESTVLITDEHVYKAHSKHFRGWDTVVLKPGEQYKVQATADAIIEQLITMQAGRDTTLVAVGGGVVTDLTGYVASIYMRGIRFGFVPTSVLGLVDASIGGKNGIDTGGYKNLVGTIRQPAFILHDVAFLDSLPQLEWENGFAEIIKHACIADEAMFAELGKRTLNLYQGRQEFLTALIRRNVLLKIRMVQNDEFEKGTRRLLNFGHTLGHAIESKYELLHGQAISVGMTCACHFSEQLCGFKQTERVADLLEKYNLPTDAGFDRQKVFEVLKMDKKRERKEINLVLLEKIGKAIVKPVLLKKLEKLIMNI